MNDRAKRGSLDIPYKAGTPEYQREWRRLNPKTYTDEEKAVKRDKSLQSRYKITQKEYDEWSEIQKHSCAVCGIHRTESPKRLAVDHCHITGIIRGLLCSNCNRAIGLLQDNPRLLREAADYLEKNGTTTIQD